MSEVCGPNENEQCPNTSQAGSPWLSETQPPIPVPAAAHPNEVSSQQPPIQKPSDQQSKAKLKPEAGTAGVDTSAPGDATQLPVDAKLHDGNNALNMISKADDDFAARGHILTAGIRQEYEAAIAAADKIDVNPLQNQLAELQSQHTKLNQTIRTETQSIRQSLPDDKKVVFDTKLSAADKPIREFLNDPNSDQASQNILAIEQDLKDLLPSDKAYLASNLLAHIFDSANLDKKEHIISTQAQLPTSTRLHFAAALSVNGENDGAQHQLDQINGPDFTRENLQQDLARLTLYYAKNDTTIGTLTPSSRIYLQLGQGTDKDTSKQEYQDLLRLSVHAADGQFSPQDSTKLKELIKERQSLINSTKLKGYYNAVAAWEKQLNPTERKKWDDLTRRGDAIRNQLTTDNSVNNSSQTQTISQQIQAQQLGILPTKLQKLFQESKPDIERQMSLLDQIQNLQDKQNDGEHASVMARIYLAAAIKNDNPKEASRLVNEAMFQYGGTPQEVTEEAARIKIIKGMPAAAPVYEMAIDAAHIVDITRMKENAQFAAEFSMGAFDTGVPDPEEFASIPAEPIPVKSLSPHESQLSDASFRTRYDYALALFNNNQHIQAVDRLKQLQEDFSADTQEWETTHSALQIAETPGTSRIGSAEVDPLVKSYDESEKSITQWAAVANMATTFTVSMIPGAGRLAPVAGFGASVIVLNGAEYAIHDRIPTLKEEESFLAQGLIGAAASEILGAGTVALYNRARMVSRMAYRSLWERVSTAEEVSTAGE